MQKKITAAMMIAKYLELRDNIDGKTKKFEESIAGDKADMNLLENLLTEEINRLDGQAIKTEHGTAYRTTVTSFRVADREAWFDMIFAENRRDFLTTNVAKDAVKEFIDEAKETPPGLTVTTTYKTHIRRSDQ